MPALPAKARPAGDDFLREEDLLEVAEATTAKRVIAFQIAQEMSRCGLTKSEMATR